MRKLIIFFYWLLIVSPWLNLVTAQELQLPGPRIFQASEYYEEQGLLSNRVYQISQDSEGLIWFLTNKGITTFDGLHWNKFSDDLKLPNTRYSFLQRVGKSIIAAGEHEGQLRIGIFRNHRWQFIPPPPHPKGSFLGPHYAIGNFKETLHLVLSTQDSLYITHEGAKGWLATPFSKQISNKNVTDLSIFNKQVWLSTPSGLWLYDLVDKQYHKLSLPAGFPESVHKTQVSSDGETLYILGSNWLAYYRNNQFRFIKKQLYPETSLVPSFIDYQTLLVDHSNNLIFGHDSHLFHINPRDSNSFHSFLLNDALDVDITTAVFQDRDGNYWFATERGIKKISSIGLATFNHTNGLIEDEVSTILPLAENTTFIASNYSQSIISNGNIKHFNLKDPKKKMGALRILDAYISENGTAYFAGNENGFGVLSPSKSEIQWIPLPNGGRATSLLPHPTKSGSLWIGTNNGYLYTYAPQKGIVEQFSFAHKGYVFNYFRKIIQASDGKSFALLIGGIAEISPSGEIINFIQRNDDLYNLYGLLEYGNSTLLATKKGIGKLQNGKIIPWTDGPAIDRPVYAMQKRGDALWIGSDNGIYRWQDDQLSHFSVTEGMLGREINRGAFLFHQDRLWVGTEKGLVVIDPKHLNTQAQQVETSLSHLKTGLTPWVHPSQSVSLPAAQSSLEFGFRTINFHNPASIRYRYRLKGLEDSWQYLDDPHQASVRYAYLPAGNYQFELQSKAYNTDWSPSLHSGLITVKPPFYIRWWFLLSMLVLVSILVYLFFSLLLSRRNSAKLERAIHLKRAEIAASEQRFQRLWEAADMGMALVQSNGQVLMSNPSLKLLLQKGTLKGKRIEQLIPSLHLSESSLRNVQEIGKLERHEIDLQQNGKPLSLLLTLAPVLYARELHVLVMLKDVSELKKTQKENQELNRQLLLQNRELRNKEEALEQSYGELLRQRTDLQTTLTHLEDRNYELDQLVYRTSHDLRAPIVSALGLLSIMKQEKDPKQNREYIDLAIEALNKQDTFIKSMLSFSRATRLTNPLIPINFRQIISHCLEELQFMPDFPEVLIEQEIINEHHSFLGDAQKLQIIFANLISNSLKYRDVNKESKLTIRVYLQKTSVEIRLSDNGIGIASQYLPHIFEMFYRASDKSTGSGLGLYIVKQTVEKMKGTIAVRSKLGEGSEFILHIPNQFRITQDRPVDTPSLQIS